LRRANVFLVGSPLGFFAGPSTPDILAQKDLRLFEASEPSLSLEGLVVTAIFNLLPVALLYLAIPFAVRPPDFDFSPLEIDSDTLFLLIIFFFDLVKSMNKKNQKVFTGIGYSCPPR